MINFADVYRSNFCRRAAGFAVDSPLVPTVFAGAYLAYALLGLAGDWRVHAAPEPPSTAQSEVLAPQPVETPDYVRIGEWHLFGVAPSAAAGEAETIDTQSRLTLLGTFVTSSLLPVKSAVIKAEDGSQKNYKIGESLPGGGVLEEIASNRILLSKAGKRAALPLYRLDAVSASNAD